MSILVNVINQKMVMSSCNNELVAGSQQFVKFRFNLDEDWKDLVAFAQFRQGENAYNQYLDEDNCAYLPPEIGVGTCTLMLYGSNNATIGTTNYLTFKVSANNLISDAQSTEISESLYTQLVARVEALTSWNGQSVSDLEKKVEDLSATVSRKASSADLINEISRAKAVEDAHATQIALKANQSQVDELELKVTELANNEVVANLIEASVEKEMEEYLASGALANLTLEDGSVTTKKLHPDVAGVLDKANTAMQPSVYDPQGLQVDVYSYAQGRADMVGQDLDVVRQEIADAYTLTDTLKYNKLGDAIRGAVTLSRSYAQALLADYESFTIKIVDELPVAGEAHTFYLIPKDNGGGYDKYWYITDEVGNNVWDAFGGSSTVVVDELPETGDPEIDYIVKSNSGYLYYKYIDGYWRIIAGSLAYIATALPDVANGSEFTDYYIVNQDDGSYTHYRFINGAYHVIGGDAYTKPEVDEMVAVFRDSINANTQNIDANRTNIQSLSGTVTQLQQEMKNLDVEGYTYYATYGKATLLTGDEADNVFTLWECKDGKEEVKSQFVIAGGGGGGTTTTTNLVVDRITASPIIATPTDKVEIKINYSSTDSDGELIDGNYTWKLGSSTIMTGALVQGENTFDMTEYVSIGTQKFTLTVVDDGGSVNVKSWTVQVVDVRLESAFSDRITYPAGNSVNFTYTPYGSVSKTVHFILDGEELEPVVTSASGTLQSYSLPAQEHGAHLLECYITATVNNIDIETDHIFKDIVWFDDESDVPVIGCIYRYDHYGKVPSKQYNTTNIVYYVFDPNTGTPTVTHTADGSVVATETLTSTSNTWSYKTDVIGDHNLVISCRDVSVPIVMDIAELGIDVSPVTANLAFDFNPTGLSNTSENRLWTDANTGVTMTVFDDFDWINGGYQLDDDGNQYFCVKAGTRAVINYNLFERDASLYGSEFKVIFKATNVRDADATFLSCQSDATVVGLEMNAHAAYLKTSATGSDPLYIPYSEDDIVEMEFNINTLDTEDATATAVIMSYEDGVGFRPLIYDAAHRLYQFAPVPITIGSDDCDIHIYRMKAYTSALSDADILSNFIADSRDSDTMISRYERNDIYNENNAITPEFVASACPDLKIIKIDCPYFTQDKKEIIKNTTIECIHKNGDTALDNWKAINAAHSGQGTTSNEYGYAGRNLNIYMCFDGEYTNKNTTYDPDYITELTMGDGTKYSDGTGKVALTRTSVPNALFNIKVNIASSENANNALLQKRFHEFLPYTTVAQKRDPNAKTTMEFVNCVVFVRENNSDLSTHREFNDTDWHFYALGNIGDSKDTDSTRAYDPDDHNEFVVEISDNTKPNSIFPSGFTDASGNQVYPISESQWVAGNTAYDSLYGNWDETFEFRYEHADITDEEQAANIQVWNDFYKWIITSTDEEFVNELKDWTIEEASLYMYLFTERYTMVDNRAKNTFWHYAKVYISEAEAEALGDKAEWYTIDNEAAAIRNGYRFDFWDYDNDTAIGINNSGEMTMTYGKEDTDYRTDGDPNSGYIYNAAESIFFCRIRDLMYPQLQAMYLNRESAGAWSASGLISQFDTWQEMFCEELWKLDIERKYYRTYQGGTKRFLETMMNGRKRYHRRQWERDQEAYMGTKYVAASVKADQIMFRCNTPTEAVVTPNYDLKIVPYADMYLSVLYGNSATPMQIRAKAGVEYEIKNPLSGKMDDTAILIYCSSKIQELNDLSGCYIHDNDFTKASKLQKLIIGNDTEGYANSFLTELNIGNNALLQELNVKNCPNLIGSVNLTSCGNLETFYAEGTAITGVIFAPNGKIVTAHLPDTINTLSMRNLNYLTDLQVSYDNLESLTEENSIVDEYAIVVDAKDTLQTLRLTGIDWTLPDSTLLNEILAMNNTSLSGKVYVSGAIRNQELANYAAAWSDLEVTYDPANLIPQHLITYVNDDDENTVLYEVYVDQNATPPDPYKEGWIAKPTKASDEQYTYEFGTTTDGEYVAGSGWDEITSAVLAKRTVKAKYTKTVRTYTVTWYSRAGLSLGSTQATYGSEVVYTGETPTNTTEEEFAIYNVFAGWDKSTGYIRGDTDVYAIWERASLPALPNVEGGKHLEDMSIAEINAVVASGKTANYFEMKDYTDIVLGHDFDFANVPSEVIAENLVLDGETATTTNIKLFGENERSFTLAIDYQFTGTAANNTLVSTFQEDGSEGFRLRYNSNPNIQWGDVNQSFGSGKKRDMVVIRHRKGENKLYVYASNGTDSGTRFSTATIRAEITRSRSTSTEEAISFGGIRFGDGGYDDYGTGIIHWCKIWYDDIGDTNCKQLATWCHEPLRMEFYGANRYRLAGNTSQKSNASFICNHLLADRVYWMNSTNTNVGGWDASLMRTFLNTRIYEALPTVWKSMLKKVKINASAGNKLTEIIVSEDNVYLASTTELSNNTSEPYASEGDYITWYTSNPKRVKFQGYVIPDGATYYSTSSDPSAVSTNNVKEGDVWIHTGVDSVGHIYVPQETIDKYKITPTYTASIGGGWVKSNYWWLRSPIIGSTANFWSVSNIGIVSANGANSTGGVCPCFSI